MLFIILIKSFNEIIPAIIEKIVPMSIALMFVIWLMFLISNNAAPAIAGMNKRNENLINCCCFIFCINPDERVIPDLETPGNIAIAWNIPIMYVFFRVRLEFCLAFFERKSIIEVKINDSPTAVRLLNIDFM